MSKQVKITFFNVDNCLPPENQCKDDAPKNLSQYVFFQDDDGYSYLGHYDFKTQSWVNSNRRQIDNKVVQWMHMPVILAEVQTL